MRLIDADELQKKIGEKIDYKIKWTLEPNVYVFHANEIFDMIETAPTVIKCGITSEGLPLMDLTPRQQDKWGKWVISEIQCPICLEYFQTDCYSTEELKKCPSCGADLRGAE